MVSTSIQSNSHSADVMGVKCLQPGLPFLEVQKYTYPLWIFNEICTQQKGDFIKSRKQKKKTIPSGCKHQ